jgi:hypothetical protein
LELPHRGLFSLSTCNPGERCIDGLNGAHDVDHPAAPSDAHAATCLSALLKLFLLGTTQFGLKLVFLAVGGQKVSATQNALINTLETPLPVSMGVGLFQQGTFYRQTSQAA